MELAPFIILPIVAIIGGFTGFALTKYINNFPPPEGHEDEPQWKAPNWAIILSSVIIYTLAGIIAITNTLPLPGILGVFYLATITIPLSWIDLRVHRLPNDITLPSIAVTGILFTLSSIMKNGIGTGLLTIGISLLIWFGLHGIIWFASKGRLVGFGDVKLSLSLGFIMGTFTISTIILSIYATYFLAAVILVVLLALKFVNRKTPIPFGQFMLLGTWVAIFAATFNVFA